MSSRPLGAGSFTFRDRPFVGRGFPNLGGRAIRHLGGAVISVCTSTSYDEGTMARLFPWCLFELFVLFPCQTERFPKDAPLGDGYQARAAQETRQIHNDR